MGPELTQRRVAELLTPDRVSSVSTLQPSLLRLKEQLRGIESSGHPSGDIQRTIALRGFLPQSLLARLDDIEDALNTFELELKWVEPRSSAAMCARWLTSRARAASTRCLLRRVH
eukprot:10741617-Alexandrium_andersonii.AAC.1